MSIPVRLLAVFFSLVMLAASGYSQTTRHDGNWWLRLNDEARTFFMVGFFRGMSFGSNSVLNASQIKHSVEQSRSLEAEFESQTGRYFSNVSVGQLSEGLTAYYGDFRNRSIPVSLAISVVTKQIGGLPQQQIEAMSELLRRRAQEAR